MKTPTVEAARTLGLHPVRLLLYLAEVGVPSFEEFWPEIEDSWVEAIRRAHWDHLGPKRPNYTSDTSQASASRGTDPDLGETAGMVLDKLWRKKKWGVARVTIEALVKMIHRPSVDVETALEELKARRLVLRHDDQYSLDSSRTAEVERIAKALASAE